MAARQSAVHHERLSIDVAGFVRRQKQGRAGDLDWLTTGPQRLALADATRLTFVADCVVHRLGHARFDEARADRIHANARTGELLSRSLDEIDHASFGR